MLITIFSDASYQEGKAGWCAWVKSKRGTASHDGVIKRKVRDNNVAELFAAVNGTKLAFLSKVALSGDHLLIQTDNERARDVINGVLQPNNEETAALAVLNEIKAQYGCTFEARHVKGHSRDGSRRSWVNNFCDARARKHLK